MSLPRLVPENPVFPTASEKRVWETLRDSVGPEATLLTGFRVSDEVKDHEADLVVLMPGVGVVVVEVKGGSLWYAPDGWHQSSGPGHERRVDPVAQARATKYALRRYVEADPRWRGSSRSRVVWAHAVVAPYSGFDDDFETPDCPRWAVHGRDDLDRLAERLGDTAARQVTNARRPTYDDVELITEILAGGRGPRGRRLGQDGPRAGAGARPDPGQGGPPGAAGRAAVLLDRSGGVFQAHRRHLAAPAPAGVRRHLRRARPVLGRPRRRPHRRPLLGGGAARHDGRAGRRAAARPALRRDDRRRGPGLR